MKYGVAAPERLGTTRLPDGRGLGWAEWGPQGGTPVLFLLAMSRWPFAPEDICMPVELWVRVEFSAFDN